MAKATPWGRTMIAPVMPAIMSARAVRRLTRDHHRKKGKTFAVSMLSPGLNGFFHIFGTGQEVACFALPRSMPRYDHWCAVTSRKSYSSPPRVLRRLTRGKICYNLIHVQKPDTSIYQPQ